MKYIKNITGFLLAATLCVAGQSCADWLDKQPTDRVLEEQVYSSEIKINDALNGIYMSMASTSVYGRNLTFYTTELLAQRYIMTTSAGVLSSNKERAELCEFDYTSEEFTKNHLNTIYSKGYNVILNINLFIEKLTATEGIVSESRKSLMLGEAYALRAFMHFDLLRLYGPVPSVNPNGKSIPYYTKADVEWQDIETFSAIIDKIMGDIETAQKLLENDPVLTDGVIIGDDADIYALDFFYKQYRNRRMNYFAVEALKARLLMYKGGEKDVTEAALIAKNLLENPAFEKAFPWAVSEDVNKAEKEDRIFSKEVIFGIHVSTMYSQWDSWFNPGKSSTQEILGVHQSNYAYMYYAVGADASTDWRSKYWADFPHDITFKLSSKFQRTAKETEMWYFQPLIRKSELSLIAAEVYKDISYVNDIRTHRNLVETNMPATDEEFRTIIEKEYMKEFMGEGQLWFYYKRLNQTNIRTNNPSGTTLTKTVTASQYVIPKPAKEIEDR